MDCKREWFLSLGHPREVKVIKFLKDSGNRLIDGGGIRVSEGQLTVDR